jgi:phosphoglycerol transferase MdoB-like AlkP superfamily enzyme
MRVVHLPWMSAPASADSTPKNRFLAALWRLAATRHGGLFIFYVAFLGVALLTRAALLLKSWSDSSTSFGAILGAFATGTVFDIGAAGFASLPIILLLCCLPRTWGAKLWQRGVTYFAGCAVLFALVFGAISEWTFWDEFGVRFNFIAVDYLVYTTEVVGNIRESYNLPLILGCTAAAAVLGTLLFVASGWPRWWLDRAAAPAGRRWAHGAAWLVAVVALGTVLDETQVPAFANTYHRELAKNGLWSLFAAFKNNSLDYDRFYATRPIDDSFARLQRDLVVDGAKLPAQPGRDTLRWVQNEGTELRPNVIQITVESLSASFLGTFNHASKLTPNLEELAHQSLVFENFYATGTRTDRGMEALTLSLPPTPGRSMIKRPNNEDMFTLGSVFRSKGYDTAFIYGGFGYFDNMNYFFGNNGYRVIDRNSPEADITFANVWGACDEDLYRWTMREADSAHAKGKPFHFFVMTTSNHRPYTFPEGKIDLPSKISGRAGAVKYTDFAIGQFIREAANKPWFKNTVFVIVADHCASSAGRAELPVENYHIPLIIYSPGGHIAPGRVSKLTSQMDYAPTLLGLLNWSYPSRFFGHDVRRAPDDAAHALIGNYQKLGHLSRGRFVVLKPQRAISHYTVKLSDRQLVPAPVNADDEDEAISYYQVAHYLYMNRLYRAATAGDAVRVQPSAQDKR